MGGTIFGTGSIVGDPSLSGTDSSLYAPDVMIDSPTDNSQYTDSGTDPTTSNGGGGLSTLDAVINDAFKAYTIASTPTSYRAAAPTSPAAMQAKAAGTQSNIITIGLIAVVIVVLYLIFKK